MTELKSEARHIAHNDADIFRVLSDLSKLELVKEQIPQDKIKDFRFDRDSCAFRIEPVGEVRFNVVEREANKLVKFRSEELPFDLFLWIQLVSKGQQDTWMQMTLRAELNPFIKGMVTKPLQEGLEKIAGLISSLPYDTIP